MWYTDRNSYSYCSTIQPNTHYYLAATPYTNTHRNCHADIFTDRAIYTASTASPHSSTTPIS
jgi:hypothetical protein